jgi:hypothetical protein
VTAVAAARVVDGLPPADYFADPALSASGAKKLLAPSCPALFRWWADHPEPHKREFDLGGAVHGEVLGVGDPVRILDFPDYKTKAAQQEKKDAYAAGEIPLLAKEWAMVQAMVAALRRHPVAGPLFAPGRGRPEQSLFWHDAEFGIGRRARLDWLTERHVVDYKTCRNAHPDACSKAMADYGYHQSDAWYLDAVRACGLIGDPQGVYVWQEKTPPYLITITQPDPDAVAAGRERNRRAMDVFARCQAAGIWPDYVGADPARWPEGIVQLGLPRWEQIQHEEALARGDFDTAADAPEDTE